MKISSLYRNCNHHILKHLNQKWVQHFSFLSFCRIYLKYFGSYHTFGSLTCCLMHLGTKTWPQHNCWLVPYVVGLCTYSMDQTWCPKIECNIILSLVFYHYSKSKYIQPNSLTSFLYYAYFKNIMYENEVIKTENKIIQQAFQESFIRHPIV